MPQVVKDNQGEVEKQTKLGDVAPGVTFRFTSVSFEQAIAGEDGAGFYHRIDIQPKTTGRVTICTSDGKTVLERDDSHLVVVHPSKLMVGAAERVKP